MSRCQISEVSTHSAVIPSLILLNEITILELFEVIDKNLILLFPFRAPIDEGDDRTVVINDDTTTSDGLAVDWIYNHIYWTDSKKCTIELSNFEGNMRKTLITSSIDTPRSIAVNPKVG